MRRYAMIKHDDLEYRWWLLTIANRHYVTYLAIRAQHCNFRGSLQDLGERCSTHLLQPTQLCKIPCRENPAEASYSGIKSAVKATDDHMG